MMFNTLRELIDHHAQEQPDKTFLIAPDSEQTMSYAELQQHVLEVGEYLEQAGIGSGEKVAMLLDNGYWTAVLMLGVMYNGAVIVPMNAVAGESVLDYVLEHSDARVLFTSAAYLEKYPGLVGKVTTELVDTDVASLPSPLAGVRAGDGGGKQISQSPTSNNVPASPPHPNPPPQGGRETNTTSSNDIAILIYTSGTTGRPKGVQLSHKNIIAGGNNTATAHQLTSEDRGLCILPLYHINADIVSIMGTLVSGGSVVLPKRFSVSKFWTCLAETQCTWFSLVPTIVAYLLDHDEREPLSETTRNYIREQVRFGRSASAPLSPEMHKQFEEHFGVSLIETMGLTETAAQILSNPLPPGKIKYGSPGIPYGNEACIMDEQEQLCAPGISGELMIRGDNVMQGYYKNEEATHGTFTSDGWLKTGDLACQDEDGYFFITGRLKELIIKGGENISPREIDEVLCQHPAVLEAAAYGVPHREYGQEVMACVVLKQGHSCHSNLLCQFVAKHLGKFKAPLQVRILTELPKGPSGKVQRLKLVEI